MALSGFIRAGAEHAHPHFVRFGGNEPRNRVPRTFQPRGPGGLSQGILRESPSGLERLVGGAAPGGRLGPTKEPSPLRWAA